MLLASGPTPVPQEATPGRPSGPPPPYPAGATSLPPEKQAAALPPPTIDQIQSANQHPRNMGDIIRKGSTALQTMRQKLGGRPEGEGPLPQPDWSKPSSSNDSGSKVTPLSSIGTCRFRSLALEPLTRFLDANVQTAIRGTPRLLVSHTCNLRLIIFQRVPKKRATYFELARRCRWSRRPRTKGTVMSPAERSPSTPSVRSWSLILPIRTE
jgi:hypothetical protein